MIGPPLPDDSHKPMEAALARKAGEIFVLRLYVIGTTEQSMRAIVNVRRFCTEHLAGRHRLEIINLREHPELAAKDQIIAAPTLVKLKPTPLKRFIGDVSDTTRLLAGLGLEAPTEPFSG